MTLLIDISSHSKIVIYKLEPKHKTFVQQEGKKRNSIHSGIINFLKCHPLLDFYPIVQRTQKLTTFLDQVETTCHQKKNTIQKYI